MESMTPIPPQRNRRAGRMSANQDMQQAVPVQPDPEIRTAPQQATTVPQITPVQEYPRAQASQQIAYQQPYAAGLSTARPVRPAAAAYSQSSAQPVARRTAQTPSFGEPQLHTTQAGTRPHAYGDARALRRDDPDARRAAALERRRQAAAEHEQRPRKQAEPAANAASSEPRSTPSWLKTVLSLMLVGVMALLAFSAITQARMKTAEDKRQSDWNKLLAHYHLTEQPDGSLRVTWQELIERYAAIYNLDPAFVTAIIRNESSFRTNAESSVGARGLMQMMPATGQWVAGKLNDRSYSFDRLYEAETSIRYGCWYLGYLSDLFQGDTVLVCAAYHAGQGEVWGWLGDTSISPDGVSVPIANIPISNTKTYAERVTYSYGIYDKLLYPETPAAPAVSDAGSAADGQHAASR